VTIKLETNKRKCTKTHKEITKQINTLVKKNMHKYPKLNLNQQAAA